VIAAAAGVTVAAFLLTGCLAATPEPTPTPTAVFASEGEAFAAAEETYRAYVDAENERRADRQSEPDPQSFLIGEALERDIDSRRELDELGIRLNGPSNVSRIVRVSADATSGGVVLEGCYDSTNARVLNEAGEDVTLADRDPTVMVEVVLTHVGEVLMIEQMSPVEGDPC
jgi:hypothetical protein